MREKLSYNSCMKKSSAIKMFGSVGALASAYGCTRQAIYQWPEDLPQGIADRVLGAYVRSNQSPSSADPGTNPTVAAGDGGQSPALAP